MILFPAIDLKDGQAVRLVKGDMDRATVFNLDPADQARQFFDQGFEWLHLVDLNGAIAGHPVNGEAVEAILGAVELPVQLGGGIRDMATIEHWLALGVERVILGTVAVKAPELVREACAAYPGRVVIGIDARDGYVAVQGWIEDSGLPALELAKRFEDCGAAAIIYTDIDRDGVMEGPNVDETVELAEAISIPVIASGGISSLADLAAFLRHEDKGIAGVISGRAIYDGRVEPAAALRLFAPAIEPVEPLPLC